MNSNLVLLKKNPAFFLNIFGAVLLFSSNILARSMLDDYGYITYAKVLIFFSLAYSLSPLGADWMMTRNSKVSDGFVFFNKRDIFFLFSMLVVGSGVVSIYEVYWISIGFDFGVDFIGSFFLGGMMVFFTLNKILGQMFYGAISSNSWKFIVFGGVLLLGTTTEGFFFIAAGCLGVFYVVLKTIGNIKCVETSSEISIKSWVAAVLGVSSAVLFSNFDRLFLMKIENVDFSEYFFWSTIVNSPIIIVSNYLGAKRVGEMKKNENSFFWRRDLQLLFVFYFLNLVLFFLILFISSEYALFLFPGVGLVIFVCLMALGRLVYGYSAQIIQVGYKDEWVGRLALITLVVIAGCFSLLPFMTQSSNFSYLVVGGFWVWRIFEYVKCARGVLK